MDDVGDTAPPGCARLLAASGVGRPPTVTLSVDGVVAAEPASLPSPEGFSLNGSAASAAAFGVVAAPTRTLSTGGVAAGSEVTPIRMVGVGSAPTVTLTAWGDDAVATCGVRAALGVGAALPTVTCGSGCGPTRILKPAREGGWPPGEGTGPTCGIGGAGERAFGV
jgi:hypothetical protein